MRMVRFCFIWHNEFAAGLRMAKDQGYLNAVVSLRGAAARAVREIRIAEPTKEGAAPETTAAIQGLAVDFAAASCLNAAGILGGEHSWRRLFAFYTTIQ
jgi:hypothetical protein